MDFINSVIARYSVSNEVVLEMLRVGAVVLKQDGKWHARGHVLTYVSHNPLARSAIAYLLEEMRVDRH